MSTVVTEPGGLLRKELDASSSFSQTWRRGDEPVCEKQIPGGNKHHTTALQAYGNADNNFRKLFNDLVYSKGSNTTTYVDGFPFKSLHFLLMDAFRLANGRMSCTTLFYGTKNQYAAKPDAEVRFGKFIRAEEKHSDVTERVIDGGTVFNITSCSIVKMDDYTCRSEDTNYLISPNEAFRVKGVRNVDNDDETYTEITLTHTRIISNHDCYLFPRYVRHLHLGSPDVLVYPDLVSS